MLAYTAPNSTTTARSQIAGFSSTRSVKPVSSRSLDANPAATQVAERSARPGSFEAQVRAHANLIEQLGQRPLPLAPWNLPVSISRQPRPVRMPQVKQHLQPNPLQSNARPLRSLVAGVALAFTVAFAAVGVMQIVGSSSAGASGAAPLVSAEANQNASVVSASPAADVSAAKANVIVQPGDSLWTVARRIQPKGDVRKLVDKLAQRVGSKQIEPGQSIDIRGL